MSTGINIINEQVKAYANDLQSLRTEIHKVIVGQDHLIESLLLGLLANGHILIEGVPGLAKTLAVRTLAAAIDTSFQRIQFTPDLLPADLTGTLIYNPRESTFTTKKGPIFANIILADEVNRAPAKVQSALLEAMQEHQVTIGDQTYQLPSPFMVLATQNPIEQEGTYPLPEAQVDRFMLKILVDYPNRDEERSIMQAMAVTDKHLDINPVIHPKTIIEARKAVDQIYVDQKINEYILDLVFATRDPATFRLDIGPFIRYGASPRASIYLNLASRAHAFLQGRGYVTPQDVKAVAPAVLRHRVIVSYEAEAEDITSEDLVGKLLSSLPVP